MEKILYHGRKKHFFHPGQFIYLMRVGLGAELTQGTFSGDFQVWKLDDVNVFYDGIDPSYFLNGKDESDLKYRDGVTLLLEGSNGKIKRAEKKIFEIFRDHIGFGF